MTKFTLGKLTPLINSQRNDQKDRFRLLKEEELNIKPSDLIAESLERLAQKCFESSEFTISERDHIQCYHGPIQRIIPLNKSVYVLSSPTPEELAEFLWKYKQNNYD